MRITLPLWTRILPEIEKNNSLYRLSISLDITYAHMNKIIKDFKDLGWINIKKTGRSNKCLLTLKGIEMANACKNLQELMQK